MADDEITPTVESLWPELVEAEERSPADVLKEQAAALNRQTKHLLRARVYMHTGLGRTLKADFDIIVPTLDDYTYTLLTVEYPVLMYPVQVTSARSMPKLATEQEFKDWLRSFFASDETRRIVGALLSQARRR